MATVPDHSTVSRYGRVRTGAVLLRAGLFLATSGTALTMSAGGLDPYGPAKATALLIAVAVCSTACAALWPERGPVAVRVARRLDARTILVLSGLLALSTVTATDRLRAMTGGYPGYLGVIATLGCVAVGVTAMLADNEDVVFWLRAIAATTLVIAAYAISQPYGVDFLTYRSGLDTSRAWSTLGNASNLGVWLAAALPLVAERVVRERSRAWLAIATAALVAGAAASALTGSRAGLAGLAAGALAAAVLARRAGLWPLDRKMAARGARLTALGAAALALTIAAVAGPAAGRIASDAAAGGTAAGRLAIWRAVPAMAAERPVLGWGVGGFRGAYPAYALPDAVDEYGRGQVLESPHNLELSTLLAGGPIALLALLAVIALSAHGVWKTTAVRGRHQAIEGAPRIAAPAGAALLGGFTALQAHFLTIPTAAFAAVLVGVLLSSCEADRTAHPGASFGRLLRGCGAIAFLAMATVSVALSVASAGVLAADGHIARAFAAAQGGDAAAFRSEARDAQRSAPWEPAIEWAVGRASTDLIRTGSVDVAAGGLTALESAVSRTAGDPTVKRDRADLLLAWGLATRDDEKYADALSAYEDLSRMAPNDPLVALGKGASLAALGRLDSAVPPLRRATALSPRLAPAWANLANVYDALGRAEEAREARERAEALR